MRARASGPDTNCTVAGWRELCNDPVQLCARLQDFALHVQLTACGGLAAPNVRVQPGQSVKALQARGAGLAGQVLARQQLLQAAG